MSTESGSKTRVILVYNADGTVMGKLRYAYKKLFKGDGQAKEGSQAAVQQPICGNCEVTHGGLSLSETTAWRNAKHELQKSLSISIVQLHRDELDDKMREAIEQHNIRLPSVFIDDGTEIVELVPRDEINVCVLGLGKNADRASAEEQRAKLLTEAIENGVKQRESKASKGTAKL